MDVLAYTIVGTVIGTVLAIETKAWLPYLSRRLLRRALAGMPGALEDRLRARWSEEIEADLAQFDDRPLGGLLLALRLLAKGGRGLAAELALEQTLSDPEPAAAPDQGVVRNFRLTMQRGDGRQVIYYGRRDGTFTRQVVDAEGNLLESEQSSQIRRGDFESGGER